MHQEKVENLDLRNLRKKINLIKGGDHLKGEGRIKGENHTNKIN